MRISDWSSDVCSSDLLMFLLDTDVISALRRPDRLSPEVTAWAESADADQFYISAISILEIEQGVLAKERVDPVTGEILRAWFRSDVLQAFADRIIAVDTEVAMRCAALHVPDLQRSEERRVGKRSVSTC